MMLALTLLYTTIAIATLALYLIRQRMSHWKRNGIPHEEPQFLTGNLQGLGKQYHLLDIYQRLYNKFKATGPFCGIYFYQSPAVLLLDLQLIKNVLIKDFNNFSSRATYFNEKDDPLSAHLFALNGKKWRSIRQKLTPTFTSGKMKFMFPTVMKVGYEFINTLDDMLKLEGSTVDVRELFARYTTDVIGNCAFGIECNSLKNPNAEFRIMGRRSFTERLHNGLIKSFALAYPKLAKRLGIMFFPKDITAFFLNVLRETIAFREANNVKRNDFMDLVLELKNSAENQMLPAKEKLTVEKLAAHAYAFYLAGFETSATTSSFALFELAKHQDIQDRLRAEINEVFKKHKQQFSYECIKDMQYLEQIISETLRLYTVVPELVRRAHADYPVPGAPKYVIEKGMTVIIPAAAIHCDPAYYPNPNKFNPDHFIPERVQARESVTWLPFGEGPRNCIGMRFGQMQTAIGLALLVQRFKFCIAKETVIPVEIIKKDFMRVPDGAVFLKVEKI